MDALTSDWQFIAMNLKIPWQLLKYEKILPLKAQLCKTVQCLSNCHTHTVESMSETESTIFSN